MTPVPGVPILKPSNDDTDFSFLLADAGALLPLRHFATSRLSISDD